MYMALFPVGENGGVRPIARLAVIVRSAGCAFCLGLCFFLIPYSLGAEFLTISGVPFEVDSITAVAPRISKVSLLGQSAILAEDNVQDWVVRVSLGHPERVRALGVGGLIRFIKNSVAAGRASYAQKAFAAVFTLCGEKEEPAVRDLVEEIGVSNTGLGVLKSVLSERFEERPGLPQPRPDKPLIFGAMIYWVGLIDANWLRSNQIKTLLIYADSLREYSSRRFHQALRAGDRIAARRIVQMLQQILGPEDAAYQRLNLLLSRVEQIESSKARSDVESIFPLARIAQEDPASAEILYPFVAQALTEEAEKALSAGSPERALYILGRTDLHRRTPHVHELTARALRQVKPSAQPFFHDVGSEMFVRAVARHDVTVKDYYLEYLQRQIDFFLERQSLEELDFCVRKLLLVRPDPNQQNDRVRERQALMYFQAGHKIRALEKLQEIQTGLSLVGRARLTLLRLSSIWAVVLTVLVGFGAAAVYLFSGLSRKPGNASAGGRSRAAAAEPAEEGQTGAFVRGFFGQALNPQLQEYHRCLASLGVGTRASLEEIKAAYRRAVKRVHPDAQEGRHEHASKDFIDITEAYERALELRKEIGMRDE